MEAAAAPSQSPIKRTRIGPTDLEQILQIGREAMRRTKKGDEDASKTSSTEDRRFREMFGCGVMVAHALWNRLDDDGSFESRSIEDMMRALIFMKSYGKEGTISTMVGTIDEKTYRKRLWPMLGAIAALESTVVSLVHTASCMLSSILFLYFYLSAFLQIVWEDRFTGDLGNDCLVSIDGTDFRIQSGYGRKFFSHKFKGSGLRYEVALCILTGHIVWINGPYEPGKWNDIAIFRNSLISFLGPHERVEADDGYVGEAPQKVKCPCSFTNPEDTLQMQELVRSRHETVNKRFKQWGCLLNRFRHDIGKHGDVFRSVAVVTQLALLHGEPLFEVQYE